MHSPRSGFRRATVASLALAGIGVAGVAGASALAYADTLKPAAAETLAFGRAFSDHMLRIEWNSVTGWSAPRVEPLRHFSLHPAAQTLQYGAHCFEGARPAPPLGCPPLAHARPRQA